MIRRIVADLVPTPVTDNRQIAELHKIDPRYADDLCRGISDRGRLEVIGKYGKTCSSPELRLTSLTDPADL